MVYDFEDIGPEINNRIDEIDIWIDNGKLESFLTQLRKQDVKIDDVKVISEQDKSKRYSIVIKAFKDYKIPKNNYSQLHAVYDGEGALEKNTGRTKNMKAYKPPGIKTIKNDDLTEIPLGKARNLKRDRYNKTHPDSLKDARLTFYRPNKLWAKHPDKCDVLGFDAKNAPLVKEIPRSEEHTSE